VKSIGLIKIIGKYVRP